VFRAGEEPDICAAATALLPAAGAALHSPRGPPRQLPPRQAAAQLPPAL